MASAPSASFPEPRRARSTRSPVLVAWLGALALALAAPGCSSETPPTGATVGVGGAASDAGSASGSAGSLGGAPSDVFEPTGHGLPGATPGSWTYLVYLLADNDLEAPALQALDDLMQIGSAGQVTILAQVDRAEGGSDAAIGGLPNFTTTKRVRVERGQLTELADLGELNLGASGTLSDFVRWGIEAAPADHYALVLRDHGGGWGRFGADASAQHDGMSLPELTRSLDVAIAATGLRGPLDLIGFDACLLGTWEVAVALRGRARYLLASEEVAPAHGWSHAPVAMLQQGGQPIALGSALIGAYEARARAEGTLARATLALTDLNRVRALSDAVAELARALSVGGVGEHAVAIGQSRAAVGAFGNVPRGGGASMVDLRLWALAIAEREPALSAFTDELLDALDGAVVDQLAGAAYSDAGGLSIYFPIVNAFYQAGYGELDGIDTWRRFVRDFHAAASSLAAPPTFAPSNERAVVDVAGGALTVSGALMPGGYDNLASGMLDVGLLSSDGKASILGEVPASLAPGGVLRGVWDGAFVELSQGDVRGHASYVLEHSGGELQTLAIPLEYQSGEEVSTVVLMLAVDAAGDVRSQRRYVSVNGAWGEHVPAAGSTYAALVPTLTPGAPGVSHTAPSVRFDAQSELGVELVSVPPGSHVYVRLRATDYAGQTSALDNSTPW